MEVRHSPFCSHWSQLWNLVGCTAQLSESWGRHPAAWPGTPEFSVLLLASRTFIPLLSPSLNTTKLPAAEVSTAVLRSWGSGSCPPFSTLVLQPPGCHGCPWEPASLRLRRRTSPGVWGWVTFFLCKGHGSDTKVCAFGLEDQNRVSRDSASAEENASGSNSTV